MARKFAELRSKMPKQAQQESHRLAKRYLHEMALDELREARRLTQENLAVVLGVNQSAISKLERRTDMYVSTLASFIRAMGGELRIEACFPDGKVEIKNFRDEDQKAS